MEWAPSLRIQLSAQRLRSHDAIEYFTAGIYNTYLCFSTSIWLTVMLHSEASGLNGSSIFWRPRFTTNGSRCFAEDNSMPFRLSTISTESRRSAIHWRWSGDYTDQRHPETECSELHNSLAGPVLFIVVWTLHPVLTDLESSGRGCQRYVLFFLQYHMVLTF